MMARIRKSVGLRYAFDLLSKPLKYAADYSVNRV